MAGKLIVIEGLDGSGKATQSELVCSYLKAQGYKTAKLTFPDYNEKTSALVKMYLSGELGTDANAVNAYAASSFYSVDRVASYIKTWKTVYENSDFIIADRYTTSNIIYQMSKLDTAEYDEFIDWLYDFEYNKLLLPKPDLVMFLDVNPEVSQKLLLKRYQGDESKKDIHEKNFQYLLQCRSSSMYAIKKLGWHVINCSDATSIRSKEEICKDILEKIKTKIQIDL